MSSLRAIFLASLMPVTAAPLLAHPHIFVEAGVEVIFDSDGRPDALRISWEYDPFFSMLLVSDMGLDADFTGEISENERDALDGFDMNWIEGYHGDVHVRQGARDIALSEPVEWTSDYRDGQLRSTHLRKLLDPPDPRDEWVIAVYDPTYFTAYTVIDPPRITGRDDCEARIFEPDWDAADARLEAALEELLGAGADIEANFPAVGELFSDEVRLTCAGS